MPPRITDEKRAAVLAELNRGVSQRVVCKRYGISRMSCVRIQDGWLPSDPSDYGCDLTEEELDAIIAEQRPTMPGRARASECHGVPMAVLRGIGIRVTRGY